MVRFWVAALIGAIGLVSAAPENPGWTKPYPAFKISGNLYYVGTEDLACYLIATPQGHILINTGLENSAPMLRKSIESLGFKLTDIKILTHMQAHFDHVAAMAEMQKLTGAKVYSTEADTPILESGGKTDPYNGRDHAFAPVHVDRRLKDGDTIALGGSELKVVLSPGHTPGSVSYSLKGTDKPVFLVNVPTVVMPLVNNSLDPKIVDHYEQSFRVLKAQHPDIWVAAHAAQFDMDSKRKAGSFADASGYTKAIAEAETKYRQQLLSASRR